MNAIGLIILVLSLFFISQGAGEIEIGLVQDYYGVQSSYAYNSTYVLCSPPPNCGYYVYGYFFSDYYCDATGTNISCDERIYAPEEGCTPDPNELVEGYYYCDAINSSVRFDKIIPPNKPKEIDPPDNETDDSDEAECPDLPEPMVVVPGLGNGTFKPPEPRFIINTTEWGEVPANQVLVVAKENCNYCMVCELADGLKGEVVGYIDFINLYQIETRGKNEAELRDNISRALELPCIELAFPHQKVFRESSPLDDPVYSGGRDRSYQIVGVPAAWEAIRDSGLELSEVNVGVVDDGLYKGYGEFDGVVHINTRSNGSQLDKPSPDFPFVGSHGTGIMNLIAADPDNGGLVGIASEPLRDNLTVSMVNMQSPFFSKSADSWYMGCLLALSQASIDSDIISLSSGDSQADSGEVINSADFFRELQKAHPDHLIVCSAGNDGQAMNGSRRFPYTYHMPNVLTVGCINNDGTLRQNSSRKSENFEVSIAVPGDQVVWGRDKQGNVVAEGGETSMSVPFVTATAALVRSLNPELNASEIKSLLVNTARTSIEVDGREVPAPQEVGGRVLAADLAVKEVIGDPGRDNRK